MAAWSCVRAEREVVRTRTAVDADAVVWLLEAADHVTGKILKIDSGMHLLGFQPT